MGPYWKILVACGGLCQGGGACERVRTMAADDPTSRSNAVEILGRYRLQQRVEHAVRKLGLSHFRASSIVRVLVPSLYAPHCCNVTCLCFEVECYKYVRTCVHIWVVSHLRQSWVYRYCVRHHMRHILSTNPRCHRFSLYVLKYLNIS